MTELEIKFAEAYGLTDEELRNAEDDQLQSYRACWKDCYAAILEFARGKAQCSYKVGLAGTGPVTLPIEGSEHVMLCDLESFGAGQEREAGK